MNRPLKRWEVLSFIGLMAPATVLFWASSACANPLPSSNSDRVTTITPQQVPQNLSPATQPNKNNLTAATITINRIEVVGSTILGAADLTPITQPLERQPITLVALQQATDAITQLYQKRGFTTSRAILPPQTLQDGVVKLQVIEGWLGSIEVQGNRQLQSSYIKSRIRLAAGSPLNLERIEAQVRLLNNDPLFERIAVSLRAGQKTGESILVVKVKEAKRYSGDISTDNYNSSQGLPEKTRLSASYLNVAGLGDELTVSSSYGASQPNNDQYGTQNNYDVSYRIPVNARDGSVQLRASVHDQLIGDSDFAALGLRSRNESYGVTFRQPLLRSLRQEFALSLGFSAQRSQTFLFGNVPFAFGSGADANGVTQTRVLQFGQDYSRRDALGVWSVGSSLSFGLDVLNATRQSGAAADGQFFSWQLQGQRVQRLGKDNLLIAQGSLQLSPHSLLSSGQFNLGGAQSVRGFRQNVRAGDNGWRLSLEGRFPMVRSALQRPVVQLAPFVDAGAVWNSASNPNGAVTQGFLAGAGLGLLWQPTESLSIRLDYGVPLVNLQDRTNGLQDSGLYFSVSSKY